MNRYVTTITVLLILFTQNVIAKGSSWSGGHSSSSSHSSASHSHSSPVPSKSSSISSKSSASPKSTQTTIKAPVVSKPSSFHFYLDRLGDHYSPYPRYYVYPYYNYGYQNPCFYHSMYNTTTNYIINTNIMLEALDNMSSNKIIKPSIKEDDSMLAVVIFAVGICMLWEFIL